MAPSYSYTKLPESHRVQLTKLLTSEGHIYDWKVTFRLLGAGTFPNIEISSEFLPSGQPCEPKSLDVALNFVGVEKYAQKTCFSDQHWRPFDSSLNERSVNDGGNLCPLWLVFSNQLDIV